MKRIFFLLTLFVLSFCVLSSNVHAVVLDFESAPTGTFTHLEEDGFALNYIGFGDLQTVVDDGTGNNVLRDSALNVFGAEVYIQTLSGDNFFFNSLDYNNVFANAGLFTIHIWAFEAPFDWSTAHQLQLNPTSSDWSTLTADALGVAGIELAQLRVNMVSYTANFSVDNIDVTSVPEPGTILLLGIGVLGLGFRRKLQA